MQFSLAKVFAVGSRQLKTDVGDIAIPLFESVENSEEDDEERKQRSREGSWVHSSRTIRTPRFQTETASLRFRFSLANSNLKIVDFEPKYQTETTISRGFTVTARRLSTHRWSSPSKKKRDNKVVTPPYRNVSMFNVIYQSSSYTQRKHRNFQPANSFSLCNARIENHSSLKDMVHERWGHWAEPVCKQKASVPPLSTLRHVSLVRKNCAPLASSGMSEASSSEAVSSPEEWIAAYGEQLGPEDVCLAFVLKLRVPTDLGNPEMRVGEKMGRSGFGEEIHLSSYHVLQSGSQPGKFSQALSSSLLRRWGVIDDDRANGKTNIEDIKRKTEINLQRILQDLRFKIVVKMGMDGPELANLDLPLAQLEASGSLSISARKGSRFFCLEGEFGEHASRMLAVWMNRDVDSELDAYWLINDKKNELKEGESRILGSMRLSNVRVSGAPVLRHSAAASPAVAIEAEETPTISPSEVPHVAVAT
ncbi:hypothetical protein AAMO2058_001040100 [Amorphochlora amoebiformis]